MGFAESQIVEAMETPDDEDDEEDEVEDFELWPEHWDAFRVFLLCSWETSMQDGLIWHHRIDTPEIVTIINQLDQPPMVSAEAIIRQVKIIAGTAANALNTDAIERLERARRRKV